MTKASVKALFQAIEDGTLAIVEKQLDGDPTAVEVRGTGKTAFEGRTPLMYALLCQRVAIARLLVDRGARVDAIDAVEWAWPVLHFAVRSAASSAGKPEHTELVRLLLAHGADPNASDKFGNGALERALLDNGAWNHWQVIEVLIEAGADRDRYNDRTKRTTRQWVANAPGFSKEVKALFSRP